MLLFVWFQVCYGFVEEFVFGKKRFWGTNTFCLAFCFFIAFACAAGCKREASHTRSLEIFAASSLTDVFRELRSVFETNNLGLRVLLSFSGSQVLRLQLKQGASADLFASANHEHIDALKKQGILKTKQLFAFNELALIVPKSNPSKLVSFKDLSLAKRLVVGSEHVPIGMYTKNLFERAAKKLGVGFSKRVLSSIVSKESNARLIRAKVELGEADAAFVYQTDVVFSKQLHLIEIPAEFKVRAAYWVGITRGVKNLIAAKKWISFLHSKEGRSILKKYGFLLVQNTSTKLSWSGRSK